MLRFISFAALCRLLITTLFIFTSTSGLFGQLLFTAGTDTNQALFERVNGQTVQINTGLGTHNLPGLSRDGRFVTFGTPEPVQGNGINPSADLYLYDRATQQTRLIVDNFSTFDGAYQIWNDVLSSKTSPNGQVVAYGVAISRALGGTGAQTTNELNIIDTATGLLISNPTSARAQLPMLLRRSFVGSHFPPMANPL